MNPNDTRNITNPHSIIEMDGKPIYTPDIQENRKDSNVKESMLNPNTLKGEHSSTIIPSPMMKHRLTDDVLFSAPPVNV